jgi:hypothetical protein
VFTRVQLRPLIVLLVWSFFVTGCTAPRVTIAPVRADHVETVAFTSMADRVDIVDMATSALIRSNFSITLANDRIGLVQSDFIPLLRVQKALNDTLDVVPDFDNLLVRITVNAERGDEAKYVQVKGTFQRISGSVQPSDQMLGLYWLEQVAERIAADVEAPFTHQVSDSTYARLLAARGNSKEKGKRSRISGAVRVAGVLFATLFVVTLASGAFGPVQTPTPAQ